MLPRNGKKNFANHISNKGLIPKIYTAPISHNKNKTEQSDFKNGQN